MDIQLALTERDLSSFDFDDDTTLSSNILDTPLLMSPTTSAQGISSPNTSIWTDTAPVNVSAVFNPSGNDSSSTEPSNKLFARLPLEHVANYGQQPWPSALSPDLQTPTTSKPINPSSAGGLGVTPYVPYPQQMQYHGLPMHSNVRPGAVFPPSAPEQPMSPKTHSDWMAFNEQEMASRPGPKHGKFERPLLRWEKNVIKPSTVMRTCRDCKMGFKLQCRCDLTKPEKTRSHRIGHINSPQQVNALLLEAQQRARAAIHSNQPLTRHVRMCMLPPDLDAQVKAQLLKVPEQQFRGILRNYMLSVRRNTGIVPSL
ncbi:hypothetical protein BKA63DRAFT_559575 [Paraphoma chrysanthemicola]|nr:hypothetical protein BKA63DRAFT_559575 [Paraphoma chrysanthemicola]